MTFGTIQSGTQKSLFTSLRRQIGHTNQTGIFVCINDSSEIDVLKNISNEFSMYILQLYDQQHENSLWLPEYLTSIGNIFEPDIFGSILKQSKPMKSFYQNVS